MTALEYWQECIEDAALDAGFTLTRSQIMTLGEAAQYAHDNIGMAFYSPPSTDMLAACDREWKEKIDRLQREHDAYVKNAETAVKVALRQHSDAHVSIGENGEVTRYNGRSEVIQ